MNNCEYDVKNNLQRHKKYVEYSLNDMEAYSDIGKERKRQEDGVLLTTHASNDDFRMIAVADGMGSEKGAFASNLALYGLMDWFQNLSSAYYLERRSIGRSIIPIMYKIDDDIRREYQTAGTTIALAIKCADSTYTLNIGDTRIYLKNEYRLYQTSKDHNRAWNLYESGKILTKDDIRFHKQSNLLTARLGCERPSVKMAKKVIDNSEYEDIYIFSDGITDCLSDMELDILSTKGPKAILEKALVNKSYRIDQDDDYYDTIDGGKDNATVAVLRKYKG